ncbi:FAD-binding oxidoreductase [Vibrio mediterranei]|uniref:FAD-dependent oxidoreductase n=1 Tax=Vibrio mediterranei TaxID=689 RepID=UPI001EFC3AF4|nr:FAD-dependent oxidoreductase [Vibrio mediterranei]MCG9666191.1 FAD-binding oxidoreductase [Vibrio mediterranei]
MKIAIIGAGWYGCHLAQVFLQKGYEIRIFEKSTQTISGASKRNQNRLHLGFHYPRDHETRTQSKVGYEWFIEHYGSLTREIDNNFYAVPNTDSTIDFETYKLIMDGTKLEYRAHEKKYIEKHYGFENMQGYIECDERVVRNDLASRYFNDILSKHIVFNTYVDLNDNAVCEALRENYDFIINCTWGATGQLEDLNYFFEPCIYFYYRSKKDEQIALTIMDGEFYSLYPYYEDIYTLTSVKHTPIGQYTEINKALVALNKAKRDDSFVYDKRVTFEKEFSKYYPEFLQDFIFDSVEFSMKTKVVSSTDYRGCFVKNEKNIITVFSGKIDTLHIAELEVMKLISDVKP